MGKKILLKKSTKLSSQNTLKDSSVAKEVLKDSPKEWMKSNPYSTHSQTSNIDEILKESKSALSKAESEPKRGRGRPRKESGASTREVPLSNPANDQAGSAPDSLGTDESLPPEAIKPILQFPFKAAALKTGFKGWELSDGEADGVAPIAASVAKKYMGASASPYAQEILLATTLAIFVGMKYMAMLEWRDQQREQSDQIAA